MNHIKPAKRIYIDDLKDNLSNESCTDDSLEARRCRKEVDVNKLMTEKGSTRFTKPLLKDGLVYEDILARNEAERKNENKINEFKNLCRCQNIREIRKYIKRNDIINSLNTRELNEDFPINKYRFVKRNGFLHLIHDVNICCNQNNEPVPIPQHEEPAPIPQHKEPLNNKVLINFKNNEKLYNVNDINIIINDFITICEAIYNQNMKRFYKSTADEINANTHDLIKYSQLLQTAIVALLTSS